MSLVNEALKKAHLEASRRRTEAADLVGHMPAPKLYVPEIRKPKTGYVIALIAAVFVVVLSGTLLRVTASTGVISLATKAGTTPVPMLVANVLPRVSTPAPPAPTTAQNQAKDKEPIETRDTVQTDLGHVQLPSANSEAVTKTFAPPSSDIVEGKVYVQTVNLTDASKVQLNGILWSEKPLAIINNITLAPGEELEGITVTAIEPKRVKLRAQGREFFIRLP